LAVFASSLNPINPLSVLPDMFWNLQNRLLDLSQSGLLMGILNITPDSFSDGGLYFDSQKAFAHARQMIVEGADILDVGGESSRPGSDPVSVTEELRRVIPTIERIRTEYPDVLISIDTYKAETARQAIRAGANIINDISALRADPEMLGVLKESDAGVVLMHMRGTPKTMQLNPIYQDPVAEIYAFLRQRRDLLAENGVDPSRIAIDPGFGFGKRLEDNLALLRRLDHFIGLGHPIAVGVSRKSMIASLLGNRSLPEHERNWPTVGLTSLMRERGARIFRVHDVKANRQSLRMTEAILSYE
jgi:dihydropteroate synthase